MSVGSSGRRRGGGWCSLFFSRRLDATASICIDSMQTKSSNRCKRGDWGAQEMSITVPVRAFV